MVSGGGVVDVGGIGGSVGGVVVYVVVVGGGGRCGDFGVACNGGCGWWCWGW